MNTRLKNMSHQMASNWALFAVALVLTAVATLLAVGDPVGAQTCPDAGEAPTPTEGGSMSGYRLATICAAMSFHIGRSSNSERGFVAFLLKPLPIITEAPANGRLHRASRTLLR